MRTRKILFVCFALIIMAVALGQGVWGERTEIGETVQSTPKAIGFNINESNFVLNKKIIIITAGSIVTAFTVCIFLAKKNNLLFLCEKKEGKEPEILVNRG